MRTLYDLFCRVFFYVEKKSQSSAIFLFLVIFAIDSL